MSDATDKNEGRKKGREPRMVHILHRMVKEELTDN